MTATRSSSSMRRVAAAAAVVVAAACLASASAAAAAAGAQCASASSACAFSLTAASKAYSFDLSPLCAQADYAYTDANGFNYALHICGEIATACLPQSWNNTSPFGVVSQSFGSVPNCGTPSCVLNGSPTCCTAQCHVLGEANPTWTFMDATNPTKGGVVATYPATPLSDSDPYLCGLLPNGTPAGRTLIFQFQCDPTVTGRPVLLDVSSPKAFNYCQVTATFSTSYACSA